MDIDYEKIKVEYETSVDEKLVEWARPYFEGFKKPDHKDRYTVCPVCDRAAEKIKELCGCDVKGFWHVLRSETIRHIDIRHGEQGKHDNTMQDILDVARIAYVLNNFDDITIDSGRSYGPLDKDGKPALIVRFRKRIDGEYYIAESVTDSTKRKWLYINSAYINKA